MNLFDLSGKVAIVTGGNGGLGRGMAQGLAAAGADLVIAARNASKTAETASAFREQYGVKVLEVQADVCQESDIEAMVADTLKTFGKIDILINNAGINIRKQPDELSAAEWQSVVDTNLSSTFLCSQAVYESMKQGGGGKIINNGSMFSIFGGSHVLAYAASKGGVVQLTKSLAVAWAKDNIQVNVILPGWLYTDLTRGAIEQLPELHDRVLQRTPQGRWGEPDDLAGTAVFLASKASDFVTGISLTVDGGYSIQAP
ncbi:MAG: 2-deoxy-D-gluconate 3-dehydrogenase [Candidatus Entotheonella factor]|uniref:2-deoxy-D-gluconate 3-dehydrogenase n=1 Tax=Entotheonella factor TaxID=1429438 RepID=W4LMT3_ENTF1|nr:glucose 1-dehydrogenase [Candidatus Entotheonella palauensis]ETW99214.1 MAG: 2-deoxy-D-gluconate 3-dehydrogenase [Candidatus Entotheonella factor]